MAHNMFNKPWHQLSTEEMGHEIASLFDHYKGTQSGRRERYIQNTELYECRTLGGYSAHAYLGAPAVDPYEDDSLHLVRSAVSTAVASIYAAQKPKPQFQTLGADWATRRKAYKLDKICECILNQRQERWINMWAFMIDAGVESCLQGTACIRVTADHDEKRIVHDLIPHPDIYFDPAEGRNPQNLFYREPLDESVALSRWPKAAMKIKNAKEYEWYCSRGDGSRHRASRIIELQYAYRLPLGPEKPGKWAAVINGEVVDSGDWHEPYFPFVFLHWEPHRHGPWAAGIGDEAGDLALRASDYAERLKSRARIAGKRRTYYREGSIKPDDLSLNDEEISVSVAQGAEFPQDTVLPPFTNVESQLLETEIRQFWDSTGISQVSAAARREQGVSSGIAMMTLNDTKAGRQLVKAQRFEQSFVDLAHQWVWRLREISAGDSELVMKWPGQALMREVKFDDADVEDDMFSVTVAPASALPHDPAGRQEMVQQLFQSQIISQETARQLIGWPDIDVELQIDNAESEYVDMLIEIYLDADPEEWTGAEYQAPEGFITNKMGALRRFSSAWFRARIDQAYLKTEEERAKADFNIKLLARYMAELNDLIEQAAQKQAELQAAANSNVNQLQQAGMAGGPPPGAVPPQAA